MSPFARDKAIDTLLITSAAAVTGPPAGGFFLGLLFILSALGAGAKDLFTGAGSGAHAGDIAHIAFAPLVFAFWSYIFGAIPALLSGLAVSVHSAVTGRLNYGICALHVAWISVAYAIVVFARGDWEAAPASAGSGALFLACGLIAAYFVHRLFAPCTRVSKMQAEEPGTVP